MKKALGNIIKLAISLGIGVGLIVWFWSQMTADDKVHVLEDVKRANYLWVIIPILISLISNLFRAERWRLLLQPMGYKPRFSSTLFSVLIMYLLNLIFPRLGEASRCVILSRYEEVPLDKSLGTMVVERFLMDVILLGIIALVFIVVEHDKFMQLYNMIYTNSKSTFGKSIDQYQISPIVKFSVLALVGVAILSFLGYQIRKSGFDKILAALKERVMGLWNGVISIFYLKNPFIFLFHSVMIWLCYLLMGYLSFRMFPETAGLGLAAAGVCLFFSGMAYTLTPGGLGLYPIFIKIILELYGVTGSAAISLGWVSWTAQTAAVIVAGLISFALLAIIHKAPALKEITLKT